MNDCIFCKIISGDIPSYVVYEDDDVKAFLDITQATPGHTLLVPKQHVTDIFEYDELLATKVFSKLPILARAIKAINPEIKGMNIINNNGRVAYQSVFHSHVHLIPRYSSSDEFKYTFGDNTALYSDKQYKDVQKAIRTQLE
ncbi:HIT family protein [Periweissella beninensis]|uniref:HIT family protein n=1 Tax=Periweissella beninensis TaxID=504936 RepID=A0ABT0VHR0_9LACO|nr:HIT family protein [Periweissella beninensis]MBM7544067.1 histidine triad (HIT) family protein [Periweissella beninensis]MCM2437376.1 HIT family protein [Periweissella beninensis]MCT4396876.1 HIT family protein [Periweissella beninensis]